MARSLHQLNASDLAHVQALHTGRACALAEADKACLPVKKDKFTSLNFVAPHSLCFQSAVTKVNPIGASTAATVSLKHGIESRLGHVAGHAIIQRSRNASLHMNDGAAVAAISIAGCVRALPESRLTPLESDGRHRFRFWV